MHFWESLAAFWSAPIVASNMLVVLSVTGALLLGLTVGYERFYHGRAAGMRTYGLVCMASAALTVVSGYPHEWFGGNMDISIGADPTRVIQGIVTGIGFLGAGVIMKEGLNISGLTTAASIWAASVTGVLVGIGFYLAAIFVALLSAFSMVTVPKFAGWLPSRQAIGISLRFTRELAPDEHTLREELMRCGYEMAGGSIVIALREGKFEWQFVAVALDRGRSLTISELSKRLAVLAGVESFQISPARN